MKTDGLVSISGSGDGISYMRFQRFPALPRAMVYLCFLLSWLPCFHSYLHGAIVKDNRKVSEIYFKFHDRIENSKVSKYRPLIYLKSGESSNDRLVRKSIDNLYKVGAFDNIEVRARQKNPREIDLYFIFTPRYTIRSLRFVGFINKTNPTSNFKKRN